VRLELSKFEVMPFIIYVLLLVNVRTYYMGSAPSALCSSIVGLYWSVLFSNWKKSSSTNSCFVGCSSTISKSGSPSYTLSISSLSLYFQMCIYLSDPPVANITPNCLSILPIVLMLLPGTLPCIDSYALHCNCLFFIFQTLTIPSLHPEYIIFRSWSVSSVLIQSEWAYITPGQVLMLDMDLVSQHRRFLSREPLIRESSCNWAREVTASKWGGSNGLWVSKVFRFIG